MDNNLFTSQAQSPEIFIKLGEKCPTQCSGCFYGTVGSNEYEEKKVIESIYKGVQYTQDHFKFFLYGVDTVLNESLIQYLDVIYDAQRGVVLQIDDAQIFQKEYIHKLLLLSHKYKDISFLLSKNLTSRGDIDNYFRVIKLLSRLNISNIRYDISLDYGKFSEYLKSREGFIIHENKDFFNHEFLYIGNNGSISDLVVKNPAQGKLEGCKFTVCIFPDFYEVFDDVIQVKDMIEIDLDGNFRIHHPICFLSDIKISHTNHSKSQILQDFKKARKYFFENFQGDMEKSCFNCIQKGYSYNES